MSVIQDLEREIQGQVITDRESLAAKSGDFGRMIFRTPRLIVRPAAGPRDGWADAFRAMSDRGDDALVLETAPSRWDEDEWQWR